MRLVRRLSVFVAFALVAAEPSPARAHSADPMDWIIQHVCADASDKAVPVDPYGGCFRGTHERRLNINEPLPYYRHDESGQKSGHPLGLQRHDAYPIVDRHYGGVVSANDFDFDYSEPYGVMHPGDGDGYDVYRVANGWVTGGDTRDGSGYSQSFFGADCRPFGGWVFFPVDFLRELRPGAQGRTMAPIRGVYWEQAGQAWPGRCEQGEGFSTSTLTTWSFSPEHEFGGLGGRKSKRIDAIVATHGLTLQPISPLRRLHIERIYFTDLYGATRWESWVSDPGQPPKANTNCSGPTEMVYEGHAFTIVGCRDWSDAEINDPPHPHAPWPYPEENILANWHFTNGEVSPWSLLGGAMTSELMNSRTEADTKFAGGLEHGAGVCYLRLTCPQNAPDCGFLRQDIPIGHLPKANSFDYGFSGAVADDGDGAIDVSLSQRDAQGRSLWEDHFSAHVPSHYRKWTVKDSVYNASSVFLKTAPAFELKPGAVALRLSLSPRTAKRYDILDAWVMPR